MVGGTGKPYYSAPRCRRAARRSSRRPRRSRDDDRLAGRGTDHPPSGPPGNEQTNRLRIPRHLSRALVYVIALDLIADGHVRDARTQRLDHPGEVAAPSRRGGRRPKVLEQAPPY